MKPLALGALVGLLWVVFGLPLDPGDVSTAYVIGAFAAGLAARPYVRRSRRWAR